MDDGGQRLLDVIEDTHVLETILRENFPNSGLEDSSRFDNVRFDNVSSSTDSGLVSSGGLDSFVFDGQLVDPLRGVPPHSSHHTHQVSPHVLQQVLHPPSLSVASSLSGGPPHQLHPHPIHHHHQTHHLQQSNLLQQHHSQSQPQSHHPHTPQHQPTSHPSLPSVGASLDVDFNGRNRGEACVPSRNDSDHTLQQLLASAPSLGSSQPILQLHHQSHQHHLHPSHPPLQQQLASPSHPHLQSTQHPPHPAQALLPPSIPPALQPNQTLLQHSHHAQSQQQQQLRQQQSRPQPPPPPSQSSQPPGKTQHQQQTQTHEAQTSDVPSSLLPIGLSSAPSSSCPCSSSSSSSSTQTTQQATSGACASISSSHHDTPRSAPSKNTSSPSTKSVVQASTPGHGITGRVQVVGGHNQMLSSTTQLLAQSQLISGTPAQVISGGSILTGGQVLSGSNVLPTGQVLSSMSSGQVFQGSQLLSNGQVLTNHLLNNSHVITTMGNISGHAAAPLYVTPSAIASQIHQQQSQTPLPPLPPPPLPPPAMPQSSPMTLLSSPPSSSSSSSSTTTTTTASLSSTPASSSSSASFTVPSKSPVSSLPRTSPGPSYPATPSPHHTTPSPASYPNRSPAPSPHSHASAMRSPAPPTSPAVTPTSSSQSTQTLVNTSGAQHGSTALVSGMVGNMGMVQGLVPHLPITQVGGSNGVVLTQGANSMQMTPGIKQVVPGGQLIQIVSSQSNPPRHPVTVPHPKPIQPKQPQLLPKPSPQGSVRQPTPPPPGKTLLGTRPSPPSTQQPFVLGAGSQQPTVITGQQNLGSIVLNSSLLQTGLQQPILIPQPNGVQLLVRPAGHPSGAAGQTLLVPMPNQSQVVTSVGKVPQPQTLVIPGSGQTPALVIPQGLTHTLGGANMLGAAQGTRAPQPIIRFVAPQAPLQLQQINTANGPMLVAVPVGQTALNLPSLFAASNSVRALAPQVAPGTLTPQVAPGTLQISSSLAPGSLNPIQIPAGSLQVSSSSQPLQLSASLPSSLSSVITTSTTSTKTCVEEGISLSSTPPNQISLPPPSSHQMTLDVNKNNAKKKSKKKKKEKESKEDRGKGKGVSINLNELLKETGIFDENEFGGLGIEEADGDLAVTSHALVHPQTASAPTPLTSSSTSSVHPKVSLNSPSLSHTISSATVNQNHIGSSMVTNINPSNSVCSIPSGSTIPTSVCFTLDAHGKLVLGAGDVCKPHITAIAGSLPPQVVNQGGVNLSSGGTYVIGNSEGVPVPVSRSPVPGVPPVGHLVALHPPPPSPLGEGVHAPSLMKIDNVHHHLIPSKAISSHTQNEILRVAQNTQMIHSQPEKACSNSAPSLITSLLNNPVPPVIGVSACNTESTISVHLTGSDKFNIVSADGKQMSDFSSNGIITTHPSQVPLNNSAVIVSSNYANSFLPGAIISGKTCGVTSQSLDAGTSSMSAQAPQSVSCSIINTSKGINTSTMPVSMHIIDNSTKNNTFPSQYLTNIKTNIVEAKVKKSNKKKKKEKDVESSQHSFLSPGSLASEKANKSSTSSHVPSPAVPLSSPVLIHNGNVNLSPGNSGCISKTDTSSSPRIENSDSGHSVSSIITTTSSNLGSLSSVASNISVTSNSVVSTFSNSNSSTNVTTVSCFTSTTNGAARMTIPLSSTHSSYTSSPSFVVQPGHQVKQLLLSPQNQEALKRVHSQIQDLQTKKGPLGDQDKALQQKLISEYKKIMATGTPVPVSHSSLSLPPHNASTSQHNSIKYSHSVGHKKIFFTPNQKKGFSLSHPPSKKHHPADSIIKQSDLKGKDGDSLNPVVGSSGNSFSSQPITTTESGFPVTATTITLITPSSTTNSTLNSFSSVQQLLMSSERVPDVSKVSEKEVSRQEVCGMVTTSSQSSSPSSDVIVRNTSSSSVASMPIILTSTKATSLPSSSTSPTFSHHGAPHPLPHLPQTSSVPQSTQTAPITVPHPSPTSLAVPSSTGVMLPPQSTPCNPSSAITFSSQGSNTSISPMRSSFSIPLTRDQLFEHQLKTDQNGALNPDYKTPFKNKTDACKRLIRYHVYNDFGPTTSELLESDSQFEFQGKSLIKKFNAMKYKYKSLLLRESMRRHPSSETVMLYRLFNQEEKINLEREKGEVSAGKDLGLPPAPAHWLRGDPPLPDPPFPWEENWPHEKVYVVTHPSEESPSPEPISPSRDKVKKEEDQQSTGSARMSDHWEEDLDEEGQDEGRLEILMEEETDESRSQDTVDEPHSEEPSENVPEDGKMKGAVKRYVDAKAASPPSFFRDSEVAVDVRTSSKSEYSEREGRCEQDPKEFTKKSWKECEYFPSSRRDESISNNSFIKIAYSTKENGVEGGCVGKLSSNPLEGEMSLGNSLVALQRFRSKAKDISPNHSPVLANDFCSRALEEKYRHERKYKAEQRERKKYDRYKERTKGGATTLVEKETGRMSRKLKIKLKHEDKAIVPPLRIRSDERGCGGLKLTLKKQEGSSGYYRVGDEPGREYRVEQSEDEDENENESFIPVEKSNNDLEPSEGGRHLKGVSVVLEDCLQAEPKPKKELDEHRSFKKSKRLKSHHNPPPLREDFDSGVEKRENSLTWSSRFVDRWARQETHAPGFFYQSHQYALEPSLSSQAMCVSSPGQKMIHQPSRNSQRLS